MALKTANEQPEYPMSLEVVKLANKYIDKLALVDKKMVKKIIPLT